MFKYIFILVTALAFVMQANAQTYSSLEIIDGQATGNAIDITITQNPDGTVDYARSTRPATSQDENSIYVLTGANITEINGTLEFMTSADVYFIPFDMQISAIYAGGNKVTAGCFCDGVQTTEKCNIGHRNTGTGVTVTCANDGCEAAEGCKPNVLSPSILSIGVTGVFVNATNVTQL